MFNVSCYNIRVDECLHFFSWISIIMNRFVGVFLFSIFHFFGNVTMERVVLCCIYVRSRDFIRCCIVCDDREKKYAPEPNDLYTRISITRHFSSVFCIIKNHKTYKSFDRSIVRIICKKT